ncbi:GPN-loop GTPase 3 [Kipferlia bialata]|uniref:GPN-loop GTPase 3 n=1 Tax=Kipferlia bialata TaxID=797122 RepID=A0A9K3GJY9_9EUKA|nr:GPN-loop GTPase 3 [Kipferlia bialata]|eukprot:g7349.t1
MGKYAQLVVGPAGAGKTTYCAVAYDHLCTVDRSRHVHLVNLDPAAGALPYKPTVDVRELVTVDDVMEACELGPNGALVFAMETVLTHNWMADELGDYEEDYLVIDCPGQIELYTHYPIMRQFISMLERIGYKVCVLYFCEAPRFINTPAYVSSVLAATSAMLSLGTAQVNVASKMDMLSEDPEERESIVKQALNPSPFSLAMSMGHPRYARLNAALADIVDRFSLVSFVPLTCTDTDSVQRVLDYVDQSTQYGEDLEPRDSDYIGQGGDARVQDTEGCEWEGADAAVGRYDTEMATGSGTMITPDYSPDYTSGGDLDEQD